MIWGSNFFGNKGPQNTIFNPIFLLDRISCKLENSYQLMELFVCMFHVMKYFTRLILCWDAVHKRFRLKFPHTMDRILSECFLIFMDSPSSSTKETTARSTWNKFISLYKLEQSALHLSFYDPKSAKIIFNKSILWIHISHFISAIRTFHFNLSLLLLPFCKF